MVTEMSTTIRNVERNTGPLLSNIMTDEGSHGKHGVVERNAV
jgi:hypothetical protein